MNDRVAPAGKLAILGGAPRFDRPLHVGRPNIGDRGELRRRLDHMLDDRWLTNFGRNEEEFAERLREFTGTRHCIPVVNATCGMEIVIRAMGLSGEIIVPAFTFVATAHAPKWLGLEPVFADVDPVTHTLDPGRVEELITERTSAILAVHLWGIPCDAEGLRRVAEHHGLALIFDAAHAFGCARNGIRVGGLGDAEIFSFHATKFVNSFEGGAIATNDDALAEKARLMMNFGFVDFDQVESLGINGKMSEPAAAMGLVSLDAMGSIVETNRANFAHYRKALQGIPGVALLDPDVEDWNHQYVVGTIDAARCGLSRDEMMAVLNRENVIARRYFYPGCHRMEPYRSRPEDIACRLPVTERLCREVLCLPTGTAVSGADIEAIGEIIREAIANASQVSRRCRALV